jgi:outer membrane receptor protein involved in Fe transport
MSYLELKNWKTKSISRLLALALISIVPATVASAQSQDESDREQSAQAEEAQELVILSEFEVVSKRDYGYRATFRSTATKIWDEDINVPIVVSTITREFLDDLAVDDVRKSLDYTSGVFSNLRDSAGPLYIRGFTANAVYRDGYDQLSAAYPNSANVDRIEVVKGPASAFFGQARPGGIINYITKKPQFIEGGSVEFTYGSYDYKRALLDYQTRIGENFGVRLIAEYTDQNDWRQYAETERFFIAPSFYWRPTEKIDVLVQYEYEDSYRQLPRAFTQVNPQFFDDYANPPADIVAFYKDEQGFATDAETEDWFRSRIYVRTFSWGPFIEKVRGGNTFSWDSKAALARVERDTPSPFTPLSGDLRNKLSFNPSGPDPGLWKTVHYVNAEVRVRPAEWMEVRAAFNYFEDESRNMFNATIFRGTGEYASRLRHSYVGNEFKTVQVDLLIKKDLPWIKNKLLVGYQYDNNRSYRVNPPFDFSNVTPQVGRGGVLLTGQDVFQNYDPLIMPPLRMGEAATLLSGPFTYGDAREIIGFYALHRGVLLNDRLHTMLGVRHEYEKGTDTKGTTPTFGLNYHFMEGFAFFASYSENFRPNRGGNFTGPNAESEPGFVAIMPNELGVGIDIGIKTNWMDDKLSGTFTYFKVERENIRRLDWATFFADPRNSDNDANNNIRPYGVSGLERSQGLEMDLIWTPSENYQLLFSWGWMWDAQIVENPQWPPTSLDRLTQIGRRADGAPEHMLAVWSKYSFAEGPLHGLSVGFGAHYTSSQGQNFGLRQYRAFSDATTIFDAMVGYTTTVFGRRTSFNFTVRNLLDSFYTLGTDYNDPFKAWFKIKTEF